MQSLWKNTINVSVLVMTYWILEIHGTVIGRYFRRDYLYSISPYSQHLLETKHNVKNKMWCGTYCLQYKCQCASFVYDSQTKTCNMYSTKLVTTYGGIFGYTKTTGCALTIPSIDNGFLLSYSTCNVSFTCPRGYKLIGPESVQCQENEEWNQFNTSCKPITACPVRQSVDSGVLIKQTGNTVGSHAVILFYNEHCYQTVCQDDGTWSDFQYNSSVQKIQASYCWSVLSAVP